MGDTDVDVSGCDRRAALTKNIFATTSNNAQVLDDAVRDGAPELSTRWGRTTSRSST